uniref:Poly [ADP-ribose] polymerase 1 (inferred by orthology to a human protein) n=1 Tax=Strongyloides venezuelensis TaxID=75913 RepID=A0A0K0EUE3_STRVS
MSRAAKKNRKVVIDLSEDELDGPVIESSSEDDFKGDVSSSESEGESESLSSSVVSSEVEPSPVKKGKKKVTKNSTMKKSRKSEVKEEHKEDKKSVQNKRKHSMENVKEAKKMKTEDSGERKSISGKNESTHRAEELPFAVEYAKTSRATCKHCGSKIEKDELKLCTRFPSPFFDGYQEQGFHFVCFFNRAAKVKLFPHNFKGFDWIKEEDQERIKKKIDDVIESAGGMEEILKEYIPTVSIGKRSAKCAECKESLEKDELRISCKSQNFHVKCYKSSNKRFFKGSSKEIYSYNTMSDEHKKLLDELFPKAEESVKKEELDENEVKLKEQAKMMNDLKAAFEKNLSRDEVKELLEANGHGSDKRTHERNIKCLIELSLFGVPENCKKCGNVVEFSESQVKFVCRGKDEDQVRCDFKTKAPVVTRLHVPDNMKDENEYLDKVFIPRKRTRILPKDTMGAE